MRSSVKVVLAAVAAGLLGIAVTLLATGPGPLLRTELGRRILGPLLSASSPDLPSGARVARRGDKIQTLHLTDLDGNIVDFPGHLSGKPLLVNFWASWCTPCRKEMPELQRFHSGQGTNGIQVVGIALDQADAVRAFLRQVPVDYPVLLDTPGPADAGTRLGNAQGVLPYTVLVSADGRVLKQRIGPFRAGGIDRWAK